MSFSLRRKQIQGSDPLHLLTLYVIDKLHGDYLQAVKASMDGEISTSAGWNWTLKVIINFSSSSRFRLHSRSAISSSLSDKLDPSTLSQWIDAHKKVIKSQEGAR